LGWVITTFETFDRGYFLNQPGMNLDKKISATTALETCCWGDDTYPQY